LASGVDPAFDFLQSQGNGSVDEHAHNRIASLKHQNLEHISTVPFDKACDESINKRAIGVPYAAEINHYLITNFHIRFDAGHNKVWTAARGMGIASLHQ